MNPASGTGASGTNYDQTDFGYDVMKRQNRVVTPGGTITRTVFNSRGLPISSWIGTNDTGATSTDPTGGGASGNNMVQVSGVEYDGNAAGGDGNVTTHTACVDSNSANNRVTTFTYDFRNRRTDTDGEIDFYEQVCYDNVDRVVRKDRRDTTAAGNLISRTVVRFDDRGAVYQTATYAVDPATGAIGNALTSNTWRDGAGNVIKSLPAGSSSFTKTVYDSLGRQTIQYTGYGTDATYADVQVVTNNVIMEQTETTYDAASNVIQAITRQRYHNASTSQLGALANPSTTPKARVTYAALYPDALGRNIAVADYGTNGGSALSRSSTIPARSDTCLVTSMQYGAPGDRTTMTDAGGMATCFQFDARGRETSRIMNCVTSSSSSSSSSSGGCASSDDINVTVQTSYNSDGNLASITAVNASTGNQTTTYTYGTTLSDSSIASSLLKRSETYPDSADANDKIFFAYNRQGQRSSVTDQGGTVHSYDYDKLGRQTQDRVTTLGSGVDGAIRRIATTFEVRGMIQNLTSYDNATVGSGAIANDCQFVYNSFSQLTTEYQSHSGAVNTMTTPKVQYGYANGSANTIRPTSMTYPNGRVLNYDYGTAGGINDAASRIAALIDSDGITHLADYAYLGAAIPPLNKGGPGGVLPTVSNPFTPNRTVEVDYTQPDIKYTLVGTAGGDDPDTGDIYRGFDRFSRVKDSYWYNYGTSTDVDRIKYGYSRSGNRTYRENTVATAAGKSFDESYFYDLIQRLKTMDRGTLNALKTAVTNKQFAQCWSLDSTGNWKGFRQDDTGDGTWDLVQARTDNPVNEITAISNSVGPVWTQPAYSRAGNMTTVPQPADPTKAYTCTYDAWNRLVKVVDASTGNTVTEYVYDGAKRQIVKKTYTAGVLSETRHHYFTEPSRWQIIEERTGTTPSSASAERQFVWGIRYIDDLVERDRDTDGNGTLDERLYAFQDANWNVTAIANTTGTVQERSAYSAYGSPSFLTGTFGARTTSSFAWETLYAGYRWNSNARLFTVRNRVYSAGLGIWLQRDELGVVIDAGLYLYVSGNPVSAFDPSGSLEPISECLIGAAIGGTIGGLFSLLNSYVNNETACQTECKAVVNIIAGAVGGCVGAVLINPCLATALANFGALIGAAVCDSMCGCPVSNAALACGLAASLVSTVLTCWGLTGADIHNLPPGDALDVYNSIVSALASAVGAALGVDAGAICGF